MRNKILKHYWIAILVLPILDYGYFTNLFDLIEESVIMTIVASIIVAFANIGMIVHFLQFLSKNK